MDTEEKMGQIIMADALWVNKCRRGAPLNYEIKQPSMEELEEWKSQLRPEYREQIIRCKGGAFVLTDEPDPYFKKQEILQQKIKFKIVEVISKVFGWN